MPLKARACEYGTIKNKADLLPSSCLVAIHDRLAEIIHKHEPDCCAVEGIIFVQSYKTAITMGAARGAAILAAAGARAAGVRILAARGQAGGGRTRRRGENAGGVHGPRAARADGNPRADAADALAIGLTHLREQSSPHAEKSRPWRI